MRDAQCYCKLRSVTLGGRAPGGAGTWRGDRARADPGHDGPRAHSQSSSRSEAAAWSSASTLCRA